MNCQETARKLIKASNILKDIKNFLQYEKTELILTRFLDSHDVFIFMSCGWFMNQFKVYDL